MVREGDAFVSLLKELTADLDAGERYVFLARTGLQGLEPESLTNLADAAGIQLETLRRIYDRARRKVENAATRLGIDLEELPSPPHGD